MNTLPTSCPICDGDIFVGSFQCRQCDATVSGRFALGTSSEFADEKLPILRRFARLSDEQLQLLDAFVRNEGKLKYLQEEMGISYPTLRARLDEMTRDLGYTPRGEEEKGAESPAVDRSKVLLQLKEGAISAEEAVRLLREGRS